MPISLLSLPTAGEQNYNSGDIDYITAGDPVLWTNTNRPHKNLAYRDNLIASKLNETIGVLNAINVSTINLDIDNLQAALGNNNSSMGWPVDVTSFALNANTQTAIIGLDTAVALKAPLTTTNNLQTALGNTNSSMGWPGTVVNFLTTDNTKTAITKLDTQLNIASIDASDAKGWLEDSVPTGTWSPDNQYATGNKSVFEAINELDATLQDADPALVAHVVASLELDSVTGHHLFSTDAFPPSSPGNDYESRTVRDTVKLTIDNLITTQSGLNTLSTNHGNTLSSLNTLKADLAPSTTYRRPLKFKQSEGAFHSFQAEVFTIDQLEALEQGQEPAPVFRFTSGPALRYHYMVPVAAPKDGSGLPINRTYNFTLNPLPLNPAVDPDSTPYSIGETSHNYLTLTYRRHKYRHVETGDFRDAPLGIIPKDNFDAFPWVSLYAKSGSFEDSTCLDFSFIDYDTGEVELIFKEDYRPFYNPANVNYPPLIYASWFSTPKKSYIFYGTQGSDDGLLNDRAVIIPVRHDGLPDRRYLNSATNSLVRNHWSPKYNAPLANSGASYLTYLPQHLYENDIVAVGTPIFVRLRAIQESAYTGNMLAGPWSGSTLTF